ncbi:hypothetical protein B0H14DRAFT_3510608 [Mycena olivaceomarginata]|nr:hypothetical protein B0H14DRAFT_3510608 [Mycena olivaceomarginata]
MEVQTSNFAWPDESVDKTSRKIITNRKWLAKTNDGTGHVVHKPGAALSDFDQQLGVEPEKSDNILSWVRGDGASHATIMRLKKYLVTSENIYHSFRNVISTPET